MATLSDLSSPISAAIAEGDSRGNGASGQRQFGSCQLYPRLGQARLKIFTVNPLRLPT